MGSGKSSTGQKLARRMGYAFVDTDRLIVERFGISVNEIFDRLGEKRFRESETNLLNELISKDNLVVSTGGGLPCHADNMDIINRNGLSVYLKLSPAVLHERLLTRKHKRPLIRDLSDSGLKAFIDAKLAERETYYNRARFIVAGPDVDLDELLKLLRS